MLGSLKLVGAPEVCLQRIYVVSLTDQATCMTAADDALFAHFLQADAEVCSRQEFIYTA
jgi:hypothetical protein